MSQISGERTFPLLFRKTFLGVVTRAFLIGDEKEMLSWDMASGSGEGDRSKAVGAMLSANKSDCCECPSITIDLLVVLVVQNTPSREVQELGK